MRGRAAGPGIACGAGLPRSYCDPAIKVITEAGGEIVEELALERGQTDATAQVLRLKQANPDFILGCLYEAETVIFLRDAKKYGVRIPVMGTAGTDLENTLERLGDLDAVRDYYVLHVFVDKVDGPKMTKWNDIILKYNPDETITGFSTVSMASGVAAVKALEAVGPDLTRSKFIAELENISGLETGILACDITWTPTDRHGCKESAVAGFIDGKPTVLSAWGKPLAVFFLVFYRTTVGTVIQAVYQSERGATLIGVNVDAFHQTMWGVGLAMGAMGGILIAPISLLHPDLGATFLIRGFAAMTLGGFGSLGGAVVGGLLLGVAEQNLGFYVNSALIDITAPGISLQPDCRAVAQSIASQNDSRCSSTASMASTRAAVSAQATWKTPSQKLGLARIPVEVAVRDGCCVARSDVNGPPVHR